MASTRSTLHKPRKRPAQARAQATVDALLEATARILVQRGWAGTTTNHIAARAGVSIGTLYQYFPSKEALAYALVSRHVDRAEARLAQLGASWPEGPPSLEVLVHSMVEAMIELHADRPRLHRVLFDEVPHPAALRRRVLDLESKHTAALALALHTLGITPRERIALRARLAIDVLEAVTHRWVVGPNDETPADRAALHDELERMLLATLRPDEPPVC